MIRSTHTTHHHLSTVRSTNRKISARASTAAPAKIALPSWLGERPVVLHGLDQGPQSLRSVLLTYCGMNPASANPHWSGTHGDPKLVPGAAGIIETAFAKTPQEILDYVSAVILCVKRNQGVVTFDTDYHTMAIYLPREIEGRRVETPGSFHKTHFGICSLGQDRFAFGGTNWGIDMTEGLDLPRVDGKTIVPVLLPPYVEPPKPKPISASSAQVETKPAWSFWGWLKTLI